MSDVEKKFAEYLVKHDQGILQRGDDTDIDVAERAFLAGHAHGVESEHTKLKELLGCIDSQLYLESQGETFDSEYVSQCLARYRGIE